MKKHFTLLSLALTLLIIACGKDDTDNINNNKFDKVYVLSNEIIAEESTLSLWNQRKTTIVSNGNTIGDKVLVANNDTYILGSKYNPTTKQKESRIWKNGKETAIPKDLYIFDFLVINNDIYIVGKEVSNTLGFKSKLVLFKNNQPTYLTDGNSELSSSFRVFIENSNVYVLGALNEGNKNLLKLWKNNEPHNITDGTKNILPIDFFVKNNTTYILASEYNGASYTPKLWINDESKKVVSNEDFAPIKVFVENETLYIAGHSKSNVVSKSSIGIPGPQVLVNGKVISIGNNKDAGITSLFVKNSKIYVSLIEPNSNKVMVSKLWADGEVIDISNGTTHTFSRSVFVE
ncbi:exported protein of unknown function [Tenacibaculum sp. 190130A14a]|uniref:Lipoprotein n=1 Tax=Tenacibaculum polynesiense TaxID=3137857 RepID=A0ABM9PD08_9FLAO